MAQSPSSFAKKAADAAAAVKERLSRDADAAEVFDRIAAALDRLAPPPPPTPDFSAAEAFVWHAERRDLAAVARVNRVEMALLKGIDRVRDLLVENTERFA